MQKVLTVFLAFVACIMSDCFSVYAKTDPLPLPRFASIRAKSANLHVGPGKEYPSDWRYVRPGLPVEIIAVFDTWRKIRDPDGATEGWIHKSLLCGKRTVLIQKKQRKLYSKPSRESSVLAVLSPGVICKIIDCQNEWCRLEVKGHKGWMRRSYIWGVYPTEVSFK